jgi:S-formylglutathione hydrolase
MELIEKHRSHNGSQEVYKHSSEITNCTMQFAIYLPDNSKDCPLLYFLSGITCTEQNFIQKSGFQQFASKHQVAVVVPDTSPRGESIPDNDDFKLGCGAGFYLNATKEPWSKNYRMYDYITKELPDLISNNFQLSKSKIGIFGHSMGGGGAIQCALKNDLYKSVSAFSPICSLHKSTFSKDMFFNYLDNNKEELNLYDPITLIKKSKKKFESIKIDVGLSDDFLKDLYIDDFIKACDESGQKLLVSKHVGYDHGYYFINSYIEDHISYHVSILKSLD